MAKFGLVYSPTGAEVVFFSDTLPKFRPLTGTAPALDSGDDKWISVFDSETAARGWCMRKPSVLVIFLTVFIDLIGFGIVVPLVPWYSRHFGAQGIWIGVIIASFSAMQFVFSPIWGRLSDRHGRRPILLISTAGAAGSYVLFALSCSLENHQAAIGLMVLSRMLAGLCGGNITVAQAYIADITPPDQRSKRMGLIGMAFGLGFIVGPALGGLSLQFLGNTGPGLIAATLCAANFVLACFVLIESHRPDSAQASPRPHLDQWAHTLTQPQVGLLVVVFFLATFCFSCFESTLPLLVGDNFHLDVAEHETSASTVAYLFVYCGLVGALVQGGAIGRLVKKLGEPKLIAWSLVLTGISLSMLPFIKGDPHFSFTNLFRPEGLPWVFLLVALALLSVGSSLTRPPLFGLLSNLTPAHEQGATIGVAQGAGSLARILGPIFATTLLHYRPPLPYLACTVVLLATTVFVVKRLFPHAAPLPTASAKLGGSQPLT
jgi:DHA1 family tetracycline resistance protein-like MFS transporter